MEIEIIKSLPEIDLDISTDPDHYARYKFFLWKKLSNGKWGKVQDKILPNKADTAWPELHDLLLTPGQLKDHCISVSLSATSLVENASNLELNLIVNQQASGPDETSKTKHYRFGRIEPISKGYIYKEKKTFTFKFV